MVNFRRSQSFILVIILALLCQLAFTTMADAFDYKKESGLKPIEPVEILRPDDYSTELFVLVAVLLFGTIAYSIVKWSNSKKEDETKNSQQKNNGLSKTKYQLAKNTSLSIDVDYSMDEGIQSHHNTIRNTEFLSSLCLNINF